MVFEMAEQQALVTGCLYNKPKERHEVINQRKRTLAVFLKEKDIPAELLIPTNTTSEGGFEDVCTRKMLEETLIEGLDPVESSQRFAAMTPEEMRSRRAEIAQELQQRKVGAFDMLVCQSRMVADKRPAHALVWLEIACELHPNDPYVWYEAGCRAFELSQPEQAERYWTRAVEAAHDAVEREDLRRDIAAMRAAKK
jgi:tetratricopeptide (TPR) repeat protein